MASDSFLMLQKSFNNSLLGFFESGSVIKLKLQYETLKGAEIDKKAALDQSFRDILMKSIIGNIERTTKFISFSINACRHDIVSSTMPVVLLGDIFDAVTLDNSEELFTFVEDNVSIWKEELFFGACKNNLLRMCNDLLRRLSRSQNTVFCGRILLFLAKFFPFSERSGLNIVSEFNLENLTEFESNDGSDISDALICTENTQVTIDYNLYCKFWTLQDFFRNPNQCYNKVEWKTFSSHCLTVLSAFNSFKLEEQRVSKSSKNSNSSDESMHIENEIKESQHFFAKFLTNPKLLALQLSDSNFRRSVLVQCLILFQYLRSTVKFKADSYSLTQTQIDFIKDTEIQIYKLLDETPPSGKKFSKTVSHMLQREELWNNWKNDGCKEFTRPETQSTDDTAKQSSSAKRQKIDLGNAILDSRKQNKFYMGNPELTRLWNLCPDNLQACRGVDRNFLPSIEAYLDNPKDKVDPSFEWRALRLLARQSPHFFTMIQTPNKVSDYLEGVRRKIHESKTKVKIEIVPEIKQEPSDKEDGLMDVQELIKTEQLTPEEKNTHKTIVATPEQLKELSVIIGASWEKLATKLGFSSDLIAYFHEENAKVPDRALAMLQIWFDDDVDASLENLGYILEGLDMIAAADGVKRILDPVDKMEDISD